MTARRIALFFLILSVPFMGYAGGQGEDGAADAVEIEYWVAGSGERFRVWEESMADFEAANPDIRVDMQQEVGDNTQVQQKIITQIAAGNAPEVVHIDTQYIQDMAATGRLHPLNDLPGAEDLASAFYRAVQEPLEVDGTIYGYPVRANTIELIVNNDLLREAGIDPNNPPETMDELREYAIRLTKRDSNGNVEVYGFGPSFSNDSHWTIHAFSPFLWSLGGTYVDEETNTAGWSGEAGIQTLEYFDELINELEVSPVEDIENGFASGRMAMWINGEWQIQGLMADFPDLDFSFHTIPTAEAGQDPILPLGGRALVIPEGADNLEQAWRLIQWVTSKEEQMRNTKAMIGLTPRKDVLTDPWFDEHPNFRQVLEDMEFVRPKAAPNLLEMNTILFDAVQRTLIDGVPAEESLQAAAREYNAILAAQE